MSRGEFLPVIDPDAILVHEPVFRFSAMKRWFASLPADAHRTRHSARIPETGYGVRLINGHFRDTLSARFTNEVDEAIPEVTVISRAFSAPGELHDDDLMAASELAWYRAGSEVLELVAKGRQLRTVHNPVLLRVAGRSAIEPLAAEAQIAVVGGLVTGSVQAARVTGMMPQ